MRKNVVLSIILCFYFLVIPLIGILSSMHEEGSPSNPFDYARITDVDYKAIVLDEPNNSGKTLVTERLTFDIHAASKSNPFWELWRDLPESYIDGVKVEYKVNSVKQILKNGKEIAYQKSPKLYWDDSDYLSSSRRYGPGKWFHSKGPYNEDARQYECLLFYIDGIYREQVTFEIEYEMTNAALRYKDCSELYLSFYSEDTIKYLNSFKGQILFSNKDMPKVGNYTAYTYGTNSHSFPFTESDTINPGYHTFSFDLDKSQLKFKPYNRYIEFALVSFHEDKNIFTEYAPWNRYTNSNVLAETRKEQTEYEILPKEFFKAKLLVVLGCAVASIILLINLFRLDKKVKTKYTFYDATINADYFRDISSNLDPAFASTLAFCKSKSKKKDADIYSAILLSLVRKGYIELNKIKNEGQWTSRNVKIVVKPDALQPVQLEDVSINTGIQTEATESKKLELLTPSESHYFKLILRHSHSKEIAMSNFQSKVASDYEYTNTFVKNIESSITTIGTTQGYFQKADYYQPRKQLKGKAILYAIIGILLMTVVNIISYQTRLDLAFGAFFFLGFVFIFSSIFIIKLSSKYILLTQFGEDEYVKWHGLYNFLNSETLMSERTVIELPLWEQYLVYATAFGISNKVIAALKIRCPEIDTSPMLSNPYYHSTSFHTNSRAFRTATRSASYVARSGGYGGHGGYGGGGRGGGGGRRRSLKLKYIFIAFCITYFKVLQNAYFLIFIFF